MKKRQTNKYLDGKNKRHKTAKKQPKIATTRYNFLVPRLKAFLTDMFLLNMPILYITTYVFLQGKEDFLQSQLAIFLCEFLYCFVLFLFFVLKGQTPGFRYAEIMLCKLETEQNATSTPPSPWQVFLFLFIWLLELCFFLWIFALLRKDKRTLHEIISKTCIIYKENPARTRYEQGKQIYKKYK